MRPGRTPEVLDLAVAIIDYISPLRAEMFEVLGVDKSVGETVYTMHTTQQEQETAIGPGIYWHPAKGTYANKEEAPQKILAWLQESHPEVRINPS
jgi:hypothetical protein